MDWLPIASAAVSVLGTTGIGGFYLAYRRNNKEADRAEKLNEARIGEVQANTSLEIERARVLFINQLQEERTYANQRIDDLTKQLMEERRLYNSRFDEMGRRIRKLEAVLIQHNLPIPE